MSAPVVVAEIVRSGFVEGHHYGSVVALDAVGEVEWSVGIVEEPMLPRSCNKPIQALAMVRAGLDLPPDLLALACASHSGEPFHVDGVRRILAGAGLDGGRRCRPRPTTRSTTTPARPSIRDGGAKTPIQMNCSGKHAAMLATCVVNGWRRHDLPRPGPPAAGRDRRDLRRAHRRAGGGGRDRRLRRTAALDVADRPGARLPRAGRRHVRAASADRRGDPQPPGVRLRDHAATSSRCSPRSPARSARPGRSPATPWRCPTGGRSR